MLKKTVKDGKNLINNGKINISVKGKCENDHSTVYLTQMGEK